MQSVSSRIWTRVAVFISYDDNNYTTVTSTNHGHLHISDLIIQFSDISRTFFGEILILCKAYNQRIQNSVEKAMGLWIRVDLGVIAEIQCSMINK